MTQEEKQLLLKDLCARLPYGVKVENTSFANTTIQTLFGRVSDSEFIMLETYKQVGGEDYSIVHDGVHFTGYIENIKPFLRLMSSMTEEEREEFRAFGGVTSYSPQHNTWAISAFSPEAYDWLLANHFDYRGLIEKGLALEAPNDMYKTE